MFFDVLQTRNYRSRAGGNSTARIDSPTALWLENQTQKRPFSARLMFFDFHRSH